MSRHFRAISRDLPQEFLFTMEIISAANSCRSCEKDRVELAGLGKEVGVEFEKQRATDRDGKAQLEEQCGQTVGNS